MHQEIKFKRIQCLDRALDIITLASEANGLTMNEIAQMMDLKVSTVYNIVKTLSSRNFLVNKNGKFEVGQALGLAASRWNVERELPHLVEPILLEIHENTGDPVCVTVPLDGNLAEIITYQGADSEVSARYVHATWKYPLYIATGRVLVAYGPDDQWNEIINDHLQNGPVTEIEKTWDYSTWNQHLIKIREDGYVINSPRRSKEGGVSAVAVPLFNPAGNLLAAIGTSSRQDRTTPEHLQEMLEVVINAIKNNPLWGVRGAKNA
jgi:DNA-binding IclR family transcriptional regulator